MDGILSQDIKGFILADNDYINFVKSVVKCYGKLSTDDLEKLTCNETPWIEARKKDNLNGVSHTIIDDNDIIKYYNSQVNIRKIIEEKLNN